MHDKQNIEKVAAAFKLGFNRESDPVRPSADWRRKLDARLAETGPEPAANPPFARYETQIWRAGWISFAASMAAVLLFCLLNVYSQKQSAVDETLSRLYGNIIVENGL